MLLLPQLRAASNCFLFYLIMSCPTIWAECRRLRRLELRHCSGVTDVGARALGSRCKELQVRVW